MPLSARAYAGFICFAFAIIFPYQGRSEETKKISVMVFSDSKFDEKATDDLVKRLSECVYLSVKKIRSQREELQKELREFRKQSDDVSFYAVNIPPKSEESPTITLPSESELSQRGFISNEAPNPENPDGYFGSESMITIYKLPISDPKTPSFEGFSRTADPVETIANNMCDRLSPAMGPRSQSVMSKVIAKFTREKSENMDTESLHEKFEQKLQSTLSNFWFDSGFYPVKEVRIYELEILSSLAGGKAKAVFKANEYCSKKVVGEHELNLDLSLLQGSSNPFLPLPMRERSQLHLWYSKIISR